MPRVGTALWEPGAECQPLHPIGRRRQGRNVLVAVESVVGGADDRVADDADRVADDADGVADDDARLEDAPD